MTSQVTTARSEGQADADGSTSEQVIEAEIERLRSELDGMVGELDRRRHEALDLRLQLRRHATLVAVAGAVTAAVVIAAGAGWISSRRRQASLLERLQNLARLVDVMTRYPDRVERTLSG